jgi:uncharacterized membrane protein
MNQSSTQETNDKDFPWWLAISAMAVALLLLVATFAIYFWVFSGPLTQSNEKWGQFGDYVGGVLNPIFAFFGFIALLITLILQSRELQHSTRELAKSAQALKLQNDALVLQNFESTFFQMLRRFGDLVTQTHCHSHQGREAFHALYVQQLKNGLYSRLVDPPDQAARVVIAYENFYSEWQRELGHYFRTLYHIFTFVDRSHLSDGDKTIYANIIRAQLSTYELCLLFYNGVWGEGKAGFKPLIERYGILKHVNSRDLLYPLDKDNEQFYSRTAFLGREERSRYLAEHSVQLPASSTCKYGTDHD